MSASIEAVDRRTPTDKTHLQAKSGTCEAQRSHALGVLPRGFGSVPASDKSEISLGLLTPMMHSHAHSAILGSPLKWAHSVAAKVINPIIDVAVMSHQRFFTPTWSPILPIDTPTRNERSDASAC
jgi:hypothetical protein